jgi:hypothetical protein
VPAAFSLERAQEEEDEDERFEEKYDEEELDRK